uniref:Protein kinase domain-containing protein n=1 Tax=Kalanchoe fedtschenkoi TaxID=63787 RepID=A0A7N0VBR9_KALFE
MPLVVSLSQLHHRHKCLLPVSPSFDSKSRQRPRSLPLPKSPSRSPATSSAVQNISSADTDDFTNYSGYLFNGTDSDSLTDYDIYKIYARYQKKPLLLLRRLYQTVTTLGKWFAFTYLDAITVRSSSTFPIRAAELRRILVELGPAYVKIAQALSSRPDLLPQSYLDELSLLQDQIAPFPTAVAYVTIEQDLKVSLEDIFSEISPAPVAAASLGQVYKARLRDSGKLVAVKVQRPGVQAAISLDILILRFLAGLIMKVGKLNTDLQAVVDEWASSLFREMDYRIEAKNGLKFRELYGSLQDVLVPEMVLDKTTSRVLVIEWVEGKKLSEVRDLHIIEVGVYCSFNQLLECGFYHADPHPGNLLLTYDGKLAYLDFGMMGEFEQKLREGFIEACLHLINQDFKALSEDFVTLGLLPPTAEKEAVTKALTGVFESAVSKGVGNISFGDLLADLGRTMYKFKFRIPSYFSLVIRSLAVLEGIAISFDPSYKVLGSTYPWIARKVLTDSSPQLQSTLKGLLYKDSVFRIDRLESLLSESLRANTETRSVSRLPGDRDPQILAKQMLVFLLQKEQGAFLREILLEELAKGLDALGLATMESMKFASYRALPFAPSVSFSFMNEDDKASLRTFYRLLLLLSRFQKTEKSTEIGPHSINKIESEDMALMLYQLGFSREIIPILYVVRELSQEEQWYLLSLPPDLAAKLISRIAARTLRRLFLQ